MFRDWRVWMIIEAATILIIQFGTAGLIKEPGVRFSVALLAAVIEGIIAIKYSLSIMEGKIPGITMGQSFIALGLNDNTLNEQPWGQYIKDLTKGILRYRQLYSELNGEIRNLASASLEQTIRMLNITIGRGYCEIKLEDIRRYGCRFMETFVNEGDVLQATSYIYTPVWWKDEIGQDYFQHKIDAARRGALVRQIFITPNRDQLKEDRELIEQLSEANVSIRKGNIEIYAISESNLTTEKRQDIFLVGGKIAFKTNLSARMWVEGFEVYFDPEGLERWEKYFEDLLGHESIVQYNPSQYPRFDSFVDEVFK